MRPGFPGIPRPGRNSKSDIVLETPPRKAQGILHRPRYRRPVRSSVEFMQTIRTFSHAGEAPGPGPSDRGEKGILTKPPAFCPTALPAEMSRPIKAFAGPRPSWAAARRGRANNRTHPSAYALPVRSSMMQSVPFRARECLPCPPLKPPPERPQGHELQESWVLIPVPKFIVAN